MARPARCVGPPDPVFRQPILQIGSSSGASDATAARSGVLEVSIVQQPVAQLSPALTPSFARREWRLCQESSCLSEPHGKHVEYRPDPTFAARGTAISTFRRPTRRLYLGEVSSQGDQLV